MINASVSHELRNPLNSIIAQVDTQKNILKEMKDLVESEEFKVALRGKDGLYTSLTGLIRQLEGSVEILESSAQIMGFMV
jgi:signal transduction histidine kinase